MDIELKPGSYVVAVSGGVDSAVLLHALKNRPGLKLVVAHFDHGIRTNSADDRRFVDSLAKEYKLPFVYANGTLGPEASEAAARKARYEFLHKVRSASGAAAVVTAHHQDDLLETAILNLLRGTNRRGLSSLKSIDTVKRPLLDIPKTELVDYAKANGLKWREDETNHQQKYLRNYVRHSIIPKLSDQQRDQLLDVVKQITELNAEIDNLLVDILHMQSANCQLDRLWFKCLGYAEAREVMASWLRARGLSEYDRNTIERLTIAAKINGPGKSVDIMNGKSMKIQKKALALTP
jgi:tRNA(Ile)-lysidine synthetase-like protein